jgi:flavodoxin
MKSNLVVYYSWLGNTKIVAEAISKAAGGDLRRIEEVKERRTGAGFGTAALGALLGLKSRLKPMEYDMAGYQNIFLGVQVWASHSTPAINAFISKADFKNKRVFLFVTKADPKMPQKVIDSLTKRIDQKGGKVVDTFGVTTKIDPVIKPEEISKQVVEWVGKIKL